MKRPFLALTVSLLAVFTGPHPASSAAAQAASAGEWEPVEVRVVRHGEGHRLLRGGEPYPIRGAGVGSSDLRSLTAHGANSFRTWSTGESAAALLDDAGQRGLTVILCLEIGRERQGFDYDDAPAVARQLAYARGEVEKYRNHPALLAWMIGNEPNLNFRNPRVFDAINEISRMIHEVDGRHPTTVALAGFNEELAGLVRSRAPDLDFVSIQMYGELVRLPEIIAATGYDEPFMVTEWGAIGYWEVPVTAWGAPIEQNSSEKADHYLRGFREGLEPLAGRSLGDYVFLWGQKQERTPTWFGMFLEDGTETETIDVMHYLWRGAWPANRSPRLESLLLDSRGARDDVTLAPEQEYRAKVVVEDPDGDPLRYRWEIMRESAAAQEGGDREEVPEVVDRLPEGAGARVTVTAPAEPGAYRLFVYVYDGQGNAGHANVPFLVE